MDWRAQGSNARRRAGKPSAHINEPNAVVRRPASDLNQWMLARLSGNLKKTPRSKGGSR